MALRPSRTPSLLLQPAARAGRAPASRSRRRSRAAGRVETGRVARSPGSPSTSRCRTWTGRSTTWCPTSMAGAGRGPASGCGCGSPAGSSTGTCSSARLEQRARRPAGRASTRGRWPEPVLTPEVAALARAVADRYAGTLADVLRLAVPPRHAAAESAPARAGPRPTTGGRRLDAERRCAIRRGGRSSPPGRGAGAPRGLDGAARRGLARRASPRPWRDRRRPDAGRSSSSPTHRDVDRLDAALTTRARRRAGTSSLTADLGPAERYRRLLAVRRGAVSGRSSAPGRPRSRRCRPRPGRRSGTTATTCTPSRARPYPHAREVLALRRARPAPPLLVGGHARTAEAPRWWRAGWAHAIAAEPAARSRDRAPRCTRPATIRPRSRTAAAPAAADASPGEAARDALAAGRRCSSRCRAAGYAAGAGRARLPDARALPGVLGAARGVAAPAAAASCRWCGRSAPTGAVPSAAARLRARRRRRRRTAEELGRAFPGVPVRTSAATVRCSTGCRRARRSSSRRPGPSRSPTAATGRRCCSTAGRCWLARRPARGRGGAAPLDERGRAGPAGGRGRPRGRPRATPRFAAVQALVRWDPAGLAARELAERGRWASRRPMPDGGARRRRRRRRRSARRHAPAGRADVSRPGAGPGTVGEAAAPVRALVRVPASRAAPGPVAARGDGRAQRPQGCRRARPDRPGRARLIAVAFSSAAESVESWLGVAAVARAG